MIEEFTSFLREYKIISLAVAFVMGEASSSLMNSVVNDFFMPLIAPLLSVESWREASFHLGPVTIAYGNLLSDVINFIIVAFVIFIVAKRFLKLEAGAKK